MMTRMKPKLAEAKNAVQAPAPPATITLTESQRISIVALSQEEQRLLEQAKQIQAAVLATRQSRARILDEVGAGVGVSGETVGNEYQFSEGNLVRVAK
jgi:hypothetical protein